MVRAQRFRLRSSLWLMAGWATENLSLRGRWPHHPDCRYQSYFPIQLFRHDWLLDKFAIFELILSLSFSKWGQECAGEKFLAKVDREHAHGDTGELEDPPYDVQHSGDHNLSSSHSHQVTIDDLWPWDSSLLLEFGQSDHLLDIKGGWYVELDAGIQNFD